MTLTNTNNSYQGGTTLNNGVLDFVAGALPFSTTSPNIVFNGGTLQWAVGNTQDVSAGIAPISSGQSAMTDTNGNTVTFATGLNGSGGLTKIGAGTLVLSAVNSYGGTTNINGGTLSANNASAIPSGGAITFGGGVLQYTAASSGNDYSSLNQIINSGGAIAIDTNGQSVTFNGSLPASNTGGLTKIGSGTLSLNGVNAYGGATSINGGTLSLGSALPAGSTVSFGGGSLQYTASTNTVDYSSVIQNSTGPIAIDTNGQSVTFNNPLGSSNTSGLTKIGAGTLVIASASANSYGGPTVIQGGTLQLAANLVGTPGTTAGTGTGTWGTLTGASLIGGLTPSAITNSAPGEEGTGDPAVLTDGQLPTSANLASKAGYPQLLTVGNSASLTYTLPANFQNYNISTINLFAGWADNGRSQITLTNIEYSTIFAPNTFIPIANTSVNYTAGNSGPATNEVTFTATGGPMATNVYALQFNFGGQENGYVGYGELEVLGSAPSATSNLLPTATALSIAASSTFDLNGVSQQVASLSDVNPAVGVGNVINSNTGAAAILTLSPTGGATTFGGTIASGGTLGSIGLVLDGPGTMVLSGTNTYTGGTTVLNGTLVLTNNEALADGTSLAVGNNLSAFPAGTVSSLAAPSAATRSTGYPAALSAVPEPGTLVLLGAAGLLAAAAAWRRRRQ